MSMTEKEAKNKLCPFAHNGSWIVYNHGKGGAFTCEASRCMAWESDGILNGENVGHCHLIFRGAE